MSFRAYAQNIEKKTGKKPSDYFTLAEQKGFIVEGKIAATHAQMLKWLKEEMGLSHVYANFIITYFKLRTHDPKTTENMKKWAAQTGYQDGE
jgi:hypothetical protein